MTGKKRGSAWFLVALGAGLISGCSEAAVEAGETLGEEELASSRYVCPAGVPATLAPAADQTIKSMLNGVGVQIYTCKGPVSAPTWTLVAPQANLLKDSGKLVGTHFIGPTWQGNDGSSIAGARAAGATVDPAHLPWLLLNVTAHSGDDGIFSDVTSIQRLSTVGGNAPATGCDADHLGSIVQVPYSAEYVFYKTKTHGKVTQCSGS